MPPAMRNVARTITRSNFYVLFQGINKLPVWSIHCQVDVFLIVLFLSFRLQQHFWQLLFFHATFSFVSASVRVLQVDDTFLEDVQTATVNTTKIPMTGVDKILALNCSGLFCRWTKQPSWLNANSYFHPFRVFMSDTLGSLTLASWT